MIVSEGPAGKPHLEALVSARIRTGQRTFWRAVPARYEYGFERLPRARLPARLVVHDSAGSWQASAAVRTLEGVDPEPLRLVRRGLRRNGTDPLVTTRGRAVRERRSRR
jgi:hypothetical protein